MSLYSKRNIFNHDNINNNEGKGDRVFMCVTQSTNDEATVNLT